MHRDIRLYTNIKPKYKIEVRRWANSAASAGFEGYQTVSTAASGSTSVKHGHDNFTLYFNWQLSEDGSMHIEAYGGGYGTVLTDITLTPLR